MLSHQSGPAPEAHGSRAWRRVANGTLSIIDRMLMATSGLLLLGVVVVVVLQVAMRYMFNAPTVWSEELATLMFVWFVLLGIPVALRHQEHIRVEIITELPFRWIRSGVHVVSNVCFVLVFAVLGYYAVGLMPSAGRQLMSGLTQGLGTEIHLNAIYWAVPVGSALTILFALEQLVCRPTPANRTP